MIGKRLRMRRQLHKLFPLDSCADLLHPEPALGERARLIKYKYVRARQLIHIAAALYQNAPAGKRADARKEGQRHRYNQRAGTGNHQEYQRPVHPFAYVARKYRRDQRDQHCQRTYYGRVHPCEPGYELLAARLASAGVLNQLQYARRLGIAVALFHAHTYKSPQVDASRKRPIARRHAPGQRFARERRLVQLGLALQHHAVQRHPLAGLYNDYSARFDLSGVHLDHARLGLHVCAVRPHVGKRRYGVPRSVRRDVLEQLAQLVQQHYRHALGVFSHAERAQRSHCHKEALVEYMAAHDVLRRAVQHIPADHDIRQRMQCQLQNPLRRYENRRRQQRRRHAQPYYQRLERSLAMLMLMAVLMTAAAAVFMAVLMDVFMTAAAAVLMVFVSVLFPVPVTAAARVSMFLHVRHIIRPP